MVRQGDSVVEVKRVYPSFSNLMEEISTSEHLSWDIENIAIISQKLNGTSVLISESRADTTAPMEKDSYDAHATGKQAGAAYPFQRNVACITCVTLWTEYKKFTPLHGL